jgi:hypothetical protein
MELLFLELEPFTRRVVRLDMEDDLRALEDQLRENPTAGVLDPGTCGVRKIRMGRARWGRGKRFGARVHYYYVPRRRVIYFLNLYLKQEQSALTPEQKKMLCALVTQFTVD